MAAPAAPKASTGPTLVEVARAVYEIVTGPKAGEKIDPGTFLTDEVTAAHKLDEKAVDALVASGAVELVEVHKG